MLIDNKISNKGRAMHYPRLLHFKETTNAATG